MSGDDYGVASDERKRELVTLAAERRASITKVIEGLRERPHGGWRTADEHALRMIVADLLYEIGRHRQHTREMEEALGRPVRSERDIVLWCALIEHDWPYLGDEL